MVRPSHSSRAIRRPLDAAPARPQTSAAATSPWLLLGLFVSLLIPANFTLAGVGLTPYRVVLLVMVVPLLWRILRDPANRITATDLLVVAYTGWISLAILVNHGPSRLPFVVSSAVDLFGGYIVGRALIRNAADYRLLFRYFIWALAILAPLAMIELVTRKNIAFDIVDLVARAHGQAGESERLGLFRVQTVFEHYILFGLFCSMGFANIYYLYLGRLRAGLPRLALVGGMTFMALSSAPVISMGIQALITLWDRVMRFLPGRWPVLILIATVSVSVVQLAYPGGILALVIDNLAFDPTTGWGRLEIFQYGSAEVARHPVFGIGLGEWIRPWWRKESVDNFWLLTAMRYGLPSLGFLWLAIAVNALRVLRRDDLDPAETAMRSGYLIGWIGLGFTLATVHIWGSVSVFVMTYIGAGAWFYAQAPAPSPAFARRVAATSRGDLSRSASAAMAQAEPAGRSVRAAPHRRPLATTRRKDIRR